MFAQPSETRPLLRDIARDRLRSEIMRGSLCPGERLDDQELAARLGCSRTPVREALADLAHLGLVELRANRYTRVAVPAREDVVPALQALGLLFGGVVRVTVPRLGDRSRSAVFRRLGLLLDCLEAPSWQPSADAATPIYRTFIEECRNPMLTAALRGALDGLTFRLRHRELEAALPWQDIRTGIVALRVAVDLRDGRLAERATWSAHLLPDPDHAGPEDVGPAHV
ncbi:DNA-binding GntR family transcriptional regulator [Curtobacterium flaccumfaciens]|uniref:DNA-binding GntR family transcriptional regulator n=1 Tax=Curtobacterium salicis TaxID=1779862 RepID=A0ABX0T908_9MICO|nr:GntR family transcriptional regulator [Curtobacterium sp. WW7]NII40926.1 DNA-binding GntR family transcriptional regulator [Curtobacterium sp. WW7]